MGLDRGMALLFIAAGLVGLVATLLVFRTRGYRRLTRSYQSDSPTPAQTADQPSAELATPAPEGMA